MKVSSKELEAKKVKVVVDKNPVATSFEKWAQPGHFSRTLAKGPKTTTWIWNLHADAHDFDSQTNSLEDISKNFQCPLRSTVTNFLMDKWNVVPRCTFFKLFSMVN
jgi:hypothetical protein